MSPASAAKLLKAHVSEMHLVMGKEVSLIICMSSCQREASVVTPLFLLRVQFHTGDHVIALTLGYAIGVDAYGALVILAKHTPC